jgi:uncharacterized surface protein with fasciclin (FAS1) repeats
VHIIDKVLLPFYDTIANAASANGLSTLLAAVNAAPQAIKDAATSQYFNGTVFAPSNAAFEAFLSANRITATQLLANSTLVGAILSQHIIAGPAVRAAQVTNTTYTTLGGCVSGRVPPRLHMSTPHPHGPGARSAGNAP